LRHDDQCFDEREACFVVGGIEADGFLELLCGFVEAILLGIDDSQVEVRLA
jgi:hypothetical protein